MINIVTATDEQKTGIRESLGISDAAPLQVADSTARKLASTYTDAGSIVGNGLKVIQDDLPDVVWELIDKSDITLDASWQGVPRTNSSGQLPLSGVKLADGNVPFSFSRYIVASSSAWKPSSSAKYMRLFTGITIPASLVVAGNKISVTGTMRLRKDSTGSGTNIFLTFQKASMFDYIDANPSTTEDASMPIIGLSDAVATLELEGIFHAIYTLTAVTGTPSQLRLVADSNLTDGGKIWNFTDGSYSSLASPLGDTANTAGLQCNITAGSDLEIVIGIRGGANVSTKTHQVAISGGVNVFVP